MKDPSRLQMLTALASEETEIALFWFAADYHSGEQSNLFTALCVSPYRPGPLERSCPGRALDIYNRLVEYYESR